MHCDCLILKPNSQLKLKARIPLIGDRIPVVSLRGFKGSVTFLWDIGKIDCIKENFKLTVFEWYILFYYKIIRIDIRRILIFFGTSANTPDHIALETEGNTCRKPFQVIPKGNIRDIIGLVK